MHADARRAAPGSRSVGVRRPVDLVARQRRRRATSRWSLRGQRDAGVGRDRGDRARRPGRSRSRRRPWRRPRLLGDRRRRANGSPAISRTTRAPVLAVLDDELGARRRGSAAGRPRRSRRRRARDRPRRLGRHAAGADGAPRARAPRSTTTSACAEQVDGTDGQQPGVTGAAADERRPSRGRLVGCERRGGGGLASRHAFVPLVTGHVLVHHQVGRTLGEQVGSRGRRADAVRRRSGSRWRTAAPRASPSGEQRRRPAATARRRRSPSADLGQRPDRGRAAGLEGGEHGALGRHGGRVCGVVEHGERSASAGRRRRAALDRQRALPGGGQHLERVEHLGGLVERGRAGPARRGRARRRRRRPSATLPDPGVDVAADGDDLEAEAEGAQLGGPARRAGADRGCRPAARRASGRRGRRATSRGSSRAARRPARCPSAAAVGRSLSECTARSTSPASRASRSAETKTPVPPSWASGARGRVAVGGHLDQLDRRGRCAAASASATCSDWAVASALRRVPSRRAVMPGHLRPLRRGSTSARVTASTAFGVEREQLGQGVGVGLAAGLVGELLDPDGRAACSSLSTTRRTVCCDLGAGARRRGPGSRPSSRASSASTTPSAMARSATTVGATLAARAGRGTPRPPRPRSRGPPRRRRPRSDVGQRRRPASRGRPAVTPGRSAHRRVDVARQRQVERRRAGGRRRAAIAAPSDAGVQHVPDGAGAGDDAGRRRPSAAGSSASGDARAPPTAAASRSAWLGVRLATTTSAAPARGGDGGGERAIEPAPTTSDLACRRAAPRTRAARSSPAVTSERPARSMPVSAWARLPTRSACWNSALSGGPDGARAPGRSRSASRIWPRIWLSPTAIESSPTATWNRCETAPSS